MSLPIDPMDAIDAVEREVYFGEDGGEPVRGVRARRDFDTPPDDCWDAITNPERIPRWFLPVSGDLRPGGRYALEGNASGDIIRCDPPRELALTWEYGGAVSWVTVRLAGNASGGTRLEVEHEERGDDTYWRQFGPGAGGIGWEMGLLGLAAHLHSGDAVDPAEAASWPGTPEGLAFSRRSGAAWGEAAVRAGTDPDEARAAAARTIAAYTGEAPEETAAERDAQ